MARPKIDPEFHALIPPLQPEEREALEASLIAEGCRDALVTWKGILLDGHNRLDICESKTPPIPYTTTSIKLKDREQAFFWIVANQFARRNLRPYQRIEIILKIKPLIEARAKGRQAAGGNTAGVGRQKSAEPLNTRQELATLAGVSRDTIRKAEVIAEKADEETKAKVRSGELSIHSAFAGVHRELKRAEIIADLESVSTREAKAAEGVYDVLVIDPPWPITKIERDERPNQAELDYKTMSVDELASLEWYPGGRLPAADKCHVWLWTTHRFLPDAFRLLHAWGLRYVCAFVWHKPGGFQPVALPQYNCEFALYARKGSPSFVDTTALPTCFNAPRMGHSEKPDEFYATLRRVTAGRRLDMFNRRSIEGFDGWGKEAP